MDWDKLTNDVMNAATAAFGSLMAERAGEHFYAFALYTDEDCYTVEPAANSLEQHQAKIKDAEERAEHAAAYKWSTGEWAYEGSRLLKAAAKKDNAFARMNELFTGIYRQLEDHRKTLSSSEADYAAYKRSVHECMIAALKQMDANGLFAKTRESTVIFISSTDDDGAEDLENRSAHQLNSESIYLSFVNRYASKDYDS